MSETSTIPEQPVNLEDSLMFESLDTSKLSKSRVHLRRKSQLDNSYLKPHVDPQLLTSTLLDEGPTLLNSKSKGQIPSSLPSIH